MVKMKIGILNPVLSTVSRHSIPEPGKIQADKSFGFSVPREHRTP